MGLTGFFKDNMNISEDSQRHPKTSEDVGSLWKMKLSRKCFSHISQYQSWDVYKCDLAPSAFRFKNQRLQEIYYHLFILHIVFTSYIGLSLHIFGNCVKQGDNTSQNNQSCVRIWAASLSQCEIEVFNPQA